MARGSPRNPHLELTRVGPCTASWIVNRAPPAATRPVRCTYWLTRSEFLCGHPYPHADPGSWTIDGATRGAWRGKYGTAGYQLFAFHANGTDAVELPSWVESIMTSTSFFGTTSHAVLELCPARAV